MRQRRKLDFNAPFSQARNVSGYGIFYKHLEDHALSQQLTFSFLRSSGLKSGTQGFIMACQDGVFNTLVYRSRVMGVNVPDARCRACRQAPETLMNLFYNNSGFVSDGGGHDRNQNKVPQKQLPPHGEASMEEPFEFDDLLPHIGEFGIYQKILFLLMIPFSFFVAWVYFTQIFISIVPEKHWCWVPELENLTAEER
nr:unnamed protein product [Callosobruchus chinensis]